MIQLYDTTIQLYDIFDIMIQLYNTIIQLCDTMVQLYDIYDTMMHPDYKMIQLYDTMNQLYDITTHRDALLNYLSTGINNPATRHSTPSSLYDY